MNPTSTPFGTPPLSQPWLPVDGCTLPTAEQPLRVAEFDALFARSLRRVERPTARRARLLLAGDAGLPARVQRLADAESACCSFFRFTVSGLDEGSAEPVVVLDIEVPDERVAVLDGLVSRAAASTGTDR